VVGIEKSTDRQGGKLVAPALIIMAAGIGSRFGGLKQIQPVGPNGELMVEYSVFDALRAGFNRVVFVIRKEIEQDFREKIGSAVEKRVDTVYVFQELTDLPRGFNLPPERKKPWGTGHAVMSCRKVIDTPFAVINADDLYGAGAYQVLASYLQKARDVPGCYDYCMAGYVLGNTLSDYGSVARGICQVGPDGDLISIHERTHIEKFDDQIRYTETGHGWVILPYEVIVSMNMWGFTPSFLVELETHFPRFLEQNAANLSKAEFFLPTVVNELLKEGLARVKVLPTNEKWYGVTNPDDLPRLRKAIREMIKQRMYPQKLWEG